MPTWKRCSRPYVNEARTAVRETGATHPWFRRSQTSREIERFHGDDGSIGDLDRLMFLSLISSAVSMNVGDGQGESGMSPGKDIRRSRTCPFGRGGQPSLAHPESGMGAMGKEG